MGFAGPVGMFFGMATRAGTLNANFGVQAGNQGRLALANTAGPGSDVGALFAADKGLTLQNAANSTSSEYTEAWQEQIKSRMKKDWEKKQANIGSGLNVFA
jgi:hypothetical protein